MGKLIRGRQSAGDIFRRLRERGWEFDVTRDPLSIGATAPEDVTEQEAQQVREFLESMVHAIAAEAGATASFKTVWVDE